MLAERVVEGTHKWKAVGYDQGYNDGRCDLLERLLRKRFGSLHSGPMAKVRQAKQEQLDVWAERVLDAKSIEDVITDEEPIGSVERNSVRR